MGEATNAGAAGPGAARGPILELRDLQKRYGPVQALKPASLAFNYDEIHAIVGENGAGKSTLIKLLTGVIRRTGGEVLWNGNPVGLDSPQEAIDHGIDLGAQAGRDQGDLAHVLVRGELREHLADLGVGHRHPLEDVERGLGVLHADHDH